MTEKLQEFAVQHGNKIVNSVLTLILAGVVGTVGMLWQLEQNFSTLSANQSSAVILRDSTGKQISQQFTQVWDTDKDQYKRIRENNKSLQSNTNRLGILESRVGQLEHLRN
ncbi:MAG: hypothetical protein PF501_09970 [Salinisphaera sp.]|nr:hypothetical protein [Salinisphaera sp.]